MWLYNHNKRKLINMRLVHTLEIWDNRGNQHSISADGEDLMRNIPTRDEADAKLAELKRLMECDDR